MGAIKSRSLPAIVLLVVALLFACGDDDSEPVPGAGSPFYLEATITVVDRSPTVGTALPTPVASESTTVSHVRWWNRDVTHARWELPGFLIVFDGEAAWIYEESANTYTRGPLPETPDGSVGVGIPGVSVLLGPTNTPDLATFIANLQDGRFDTVATAGYETVLGRRVTIVEARPASRSATDSGPEVAHGTVRLFVDEETMLILRYEVADSVSDVVAVVTRLDHPVDIPGPLLAFEPPSGATETTP